MGNECFLSLLRDDGESVLLITFGGPPLMMAIHMLTVVVENEKRSVFFDEVREC